MSASRFLQRTIRYYGMNREAWPNMSPPSALVDAAKLAWRIRREPEPVR